MVYRNGNGVNIEYGNDAVLAGLGGISEGLIHEIGSVLEKSFGFSDLEIAINNDVGNIKPFLDAEPKYRQKREIVARHFHDKYVFIIQHPKVFDNRLRVEIEHLEELAYNIEQKAERIGDRSLLEDVDRLFGSLNQFMYLGYPDMRRKFAPRFTSSRFNPSSIEKQFAGHINAVRMGRAKHISLVLPKTIFEWSHNFLKRWRKEEDPVYEMPAYQDFINHMAQNGLNSLVLFHPHAPIEGLKYSKKAGVNLVMVYPQTFTVSSNGWIYSIDRIFEKFDLSDPGFDPLETKIRKDMEIYQNKELSNLMVFSSSVDEGSKDNARRAAGRFGFGYVQSAKVRYGEGHSERVSGDDLGVYLKKLSNHTKEGMIRIYIFDDLQNSGGTGNSEAKERKRQVAEFNLANGTSYTSNVELVVTHLRFPELGHIKHEYLDKITLFDSVRYLPPIEDQLEKLGQKEKFELIPYTPHQLALGVALDYFAQKIHFDLDRDLESGKFRGLTDKDMVKFRKYGADLENLERTLELLQDTNI